MHPATDIDDVTKAGQEAAAAAIVEAMPSRAAFEVQDGAGRTAIELLRQEDMGGIARRLDALATKHFFDSDAAAAAAAAAGGAAAATDVENPEED